MNGEKMGQKAGTNGKLENVPTGQSPDKMSTMKTTTYGSLDKSGTAFVQTGRTGHSLESCPTVPCVQDRVARSMELKWGIGRLETLVSEELAEKFQRQQELLNEAIEKLGVHDRAMCRAYQLLDAEATRLKAKPDETGEFIDDEIPF